MGLQSLVLCDDEEVLRQVRVVLHDLGIGLQVCSEPGEALDHLQHQKFELIILDSQLSAHTVLAGLRETHSNRTAVACLIGETPTAKGPDDLVIPQPFAIEDAWRILRQARGLMELEQQRYYREEINLPVVLRWQDGACLETHGRNLSVSGIAVDCASQSGLRLKVAFTLGSNAIEVDGEVSWSRDGRSGIHFVALPADTRQHLETWIAERCHEHEYAFVSPFRKNSKPTCKSSAVDNFQF